VNQRTGSPVRSARDGWDYTTIPVATTAAGLDLAIGMHIGGGKQTGPRVGLVSTHHGDEIFTADLIRRLLASLKPGQFAGTLYAVPCANPLAYEWGTRHTPQDMQNMNRVFPGNAAGWITEAMARALTDALVPQLDVLIDFHCGATDTSIHYTYTADPATEKVRRFWCCGSRRGRPERSRATPSRAGSAPSSSRLAVGPRSGPR
jgi:hypothetical protein